MPRRAVILHGLGCNSGSHWFPWLKTQLEQRGLEVWVPDLPGADHPVGSKWLNYLLKSSWDFNDTIVIGHSAGAVTALYLDQFLPASMHIPTTVLVSAFEPMQPNAEYYNDLKDLHDIPFDFAEITAHSDRFLFVHGSNDPWCPLQGAKNLAQRTNGELAVIEGGQHFSPNIDPGYTAFPKLLELLGSRHLV